MDLPGEGVLRGGRRRQVPGGHCAAQRIPGRDVVHRSVHSSFLFCLHLSDWEARPPDGWRRGRGKIESQSFEIRWFNQPEVVLELP